jgi:hypothetical protein
MKHNCTFPSDINKYAIDKAKNRGIIASEWLKNNQLTEKTQPEFNKIMKESDKQFKINK